MATFELTALEQDILGDMAWDSHGIGELAGFYRAANPTATDADVFDFVRDLISSWIDRGWVTIGPENRERVGLESIDDVVGFLHEYGPDLFSLDSDRRLPEVNLTEQAFHDVPWLRAET
jgi:hypothetical protein